MQVAIWLWMFWGRGVFREGRIASGKTDAIQPEIMKYIRPET